MQNKNAYVSQKEVSFPKNAVLISRTDCKGIITYVNDFFVEISGYSPDELMGCSHNIVRHPDMPPQAFKWLWDTLNDGRAWCGVVKNRCKSGDHYWVYATVAPIYENGVVTGYSSVRREPTRQQITEADATYKKLNASGAEIESKFTRYRFRYWSLTRKLQFLLQILLMVVLGFAQYGIFEIIKERERQSIVAKSTLLSNELITRKSLLMISGQTKNADIRRQLLETIKSVEGVESIQLLRAQPVKDTGVAQLSDASQAEVLNTGKQKIIFSADNKSLRLLTPFISNRDFHGIDCTRCHAGSEGQVLGASELVINVEPNMAAISNLQFKILLGQITLQLLLFFYIAALVKKYVVVPVKQAETGFQQLMQGDLSYEIDISGRDEIGRLLGRIRSMQSYLRTLVDEIVTPIGIMQNRIDSMVYKVELVAHNAADEHKHIQQMADSIAQFSQSVAEVANMAADSFSNAQSMQHLVEINNQHMEMSINTNNKVAQTVLDSSNTIEELGASIHKIEMITNTIKEIAEQTNLLALNAAIEAARAGEQGRGFAVVADEVRKLADRTSSSTKDIARTINQITVIAKSAVKSMQQAEADVAEGIALIRNNGEGLKEIRSVSVNVAQRIDLIAQSSREHSECGESMSQGISEINCLVKSNSEQAREAKMDCDNLMVLAQGLRRAGYPLTKCEIG